jgi:DNA-binding XRE family transcriptional regulator
LKEFCLFLLLINLFQQYSSEMDTSVERQLRNFGIAIKDKREMLSYTQQDLADLCGISDRTLREMEQGLGQTKLETWLKVCDILGLQWQLLLKKLAYADIDGV